MLRFLIMILFFVLSFFQKGFCSFILETAADMIEYSNKLLSEDDKHFNDVCNRIIEHFSEEKEFVKRFDSDRKEYLKTKRTIDHHLIFFHEPQEQWYGHIYLQYYGYENLSNLNKLKLEYYKGLVKTMCKYNFSSEKQKTMCSEKTLNRIFKLSKITL